ncbi:hypothetical protein Sango_3100500 [Sesamum angolense]|uniref:Reverse transcriptase domain-containing protein n=1 Tax=Sesamum angolense TaxID=2727404 RepID=A0AAE1W119_9LAMI|nr:hypothetical protein Sango_3100500 [Sesamum angolense]
MSLMLTSDHSPLVLRGDTDKHTVRGESGASSINYTREIKDASLTFAEDKAPGPDGYSSGFYKSAWPVIGEEMIKAILEFFTTGRLLKQVNTTILALIPKVDLRKAYDTVEWDFLSAVLQLFGFPGTFIGWVEECVTTPMFSYASMGTLTVSSRVPGNEGFSFHGGARSLDYSNFALQMTSSSSVKLMWIRFGYLDTGWMSSANCPGYMPIHKESAYSLRSAQDVGGQLLAALHFQEGHFPSVGLKDGKAFSCLCGETSIGQTVLMSLKSLLGNGIHSTERVIREVEKKMRTFLWKGNLTVDIQRTTSRPLVKWIAHTRLRHKICMDAWNVKGGSWGEEILRLRSALLPYIEFQDCDGDRSLFGMTRWHSLGSLSHDFREALAGRTYRSSKTLEARTLSLERWCFSTKAVYDIFVIMELRLSGIHSSFRALVRYPGTRLCYGMGYT